MRNWFIAFCLLVLAGSAYSATRQVVFAGDHYPPYSFKEDGIYKGIDVDIIKLVCEKLDIEPVFRFMPWSRALAETRKGEADAIYSLFKTKERREFLYFPEEPLGIERNILVVLKESEKRAKSIEDLRGWDIGVVRSNSYGEEFDAFQGFKRVAGTSNEQLILMLAAQNRIDALITNEAIFGFLIKELGDKKQIQQSAFRRLEYVPNEASLFIGFSKAGGDSNRQLAEEFDKVLKELRGSGELDNIVRRYTQSVSVSVIYH